MTLVSPLLRSLLLVDGEAFVFRAGDTPHVLSPCGRIDVSDTALDRHAVAALVAQLLPDDVRSALDAVGAAQHELRDLEDFPGERFNITAASAPDDVWIEIRRGYRNTLDGVRVAAPAAAAPAAPHSVNGHRHIGNGGGRKETTGRTDQRMRETATDRAGRHDDRAIAPADRQELQWLVGQMRQRHASSLYLAANERPSIRVDARIEPLRDSLPMSADAIEGLWRAFVDDAGAASIAEHTCDVAALGRVRGRRSGDASGVGVVLVVDQIKADLSPHLALPPVIRRLALERSGLVIHCGPSGASGQHTLRAALVDAINRTRQAHVITIEEEVHILHDRKAALVSQRELNGATLLQAIDAARAEQPDVLMVEGAADADVLLTLFEIASSGRLVVCSLAASDVAGALTTIADLFGEERPVMLRSLSAVFKGAVAQALVPRQNGGRAAAREVLVATSAVTKAIAAGRLSQLPLLLADGRKDGMNTLNESLTRLVETREVSVADALEAAADAEGLKKVLRQRALMI